MAEGGKKPTFEDFYGEVAFEDQNNKSLHSQFADQCKSESHNGTFVTAKRFGLESNCVKNRAASSDRTFGPDVANGCDGATQLTGKITTTKFGTGVLTNIEWSTASRPRVYRRPRHVAQKMTIASCPDGAKVKRLDTDVLSKLSTICNLCRKTSPEPLKRCARCLAVSYCSKDCQLRDFMNHKMFCRRCDRYDVSRARVYPAVRFFHDLQDARDYSVVLRDMPTEQQFERGAWCNLLVEIHRLVYFPWGRYSCLVGDLAGEVTRVIFHDERKAYRHPSLGQARHGPSPLDTCFLPGQFLLLIGAHWRQFTDGRPGIRINDLDSVYVINMSDHAWPKDYRRAIEQDAQSNHLVLPLNFKI